MRTLLCLVMWSKLRDIAIFSVMNEKAQKAQKASSPWSLRHTRAGTNEVRRGIGGEACLKRLGFQKKRLPWNRTVWTLNRIKRHVRAR